MFSLKDEVDIRKLVLLYSIYNCLYFSLLIFVLFWTNGIYEAGKYKFAAVISFILVAELLKHFACAVYLKTNDINLSKKFGDRTVSSVIRTMFGKSKLKDGLKNVVVTSLVMFVYFIIAILYGAEVFNKYEETFMFSSLMAVLTIFPACINLGPQSVFALVLGSKPVNKLEALLYQNLYFTVVGAWLGAFVIPLDWDRPWQVWPIPCSCGALTGYFLSHIIILLQIGSGFKKKSKKSSLLQK